MRRGALVAAVALLVSAPYYQRNLREFGTPFQLSREFPLVSAVEDVQPPGERDWRDLVTFPARAFADPNPEAEHLLRSIPGTVFVNLWSDARPGVERPLARTLVVAGVAPTLLALLGFFASLRSAARDRRPAEVVLVLLGGAAVGALLVMAYRVPTFAMLKASYLLGGSIAWGGFVARGALALPGAVRRVAIGAVLVAAVLSALASTPGLLRPAGGENERMAVVHAHFGDHARAVEVYSARLPEVKRPERRTLMREYIANAWIEAGEPARAREIYDERRRLFGAPPHLEPVTSPWWINRRAVATALDGDLEAARALLDRAVERGAEPPILSNRAALRVLTGDLEGAASDLDVALAGEPGLAAGHQVRSQLEARRGDHAASEHARREAERLAWIAPRGFPYRVGNGFGLNGQRFLLVIEGDAPALYRPARLPRAQ